ncbi:MAG: alanine/ornithine racemase family PLP-dependent enzyme [Bacillota bacterium]|jgi:predicted amino acid racemase
MRYPALMIDTRKLEHNTRVIAGLLEKQGIRLVAVAKGTCAHPSVVKAMASGGAKGICDSRIDNLRRTREWGYEGETILLRSPGPSQCEEAVLYADTSLNSEIETVRRLGDAARKAGKAHQVVLMIELGDLREGVMVDKAPEIALDMAKVPGIELVGIGANMACYGGVIPTRDKMNTLLEAKKQIEERLGRPLSRVSGGTSANMRLVLNKDMPAGITELRIGETILLGTEAVEREPVSGCYQDAFTLQAEVIEVQVKSSKPIGEIGQDTFGNVPEFEDRGNRKRAILAVGRQDVDPSDLRPHTEGVEVLGASSDHLICDVEDAEDLVYVGKILSFDISYNTLLRASTSLYVSKEVV